MVGVVLWYWGLYRRERELYSLVTSDIKIVDSIYPLYS